MLRECRRVAEFVRCMQILLDESDARRVALIELLGERDHAERLERRRSTRAAVACGLLRREMSFAQAAPLAGDRGFTRP
jgi:hypothetical protein